MRAFEVCGGESGFTEDAVQRGAAVWALALGHTTAVLFLNVTGERLLCLALHAVSLACVALSHGVLLCLILAATGPWPAVRRLTVGLNGPRGHCGTRVLCVKVPNLGQNARFGGPPHPPDEGKTPGAAMRWSPFPSGTRHPFSRGLVGRRQ